ncbi:hypothetical protein B484DRAFT_432016 [Ochromonadaceae sp. CCMP2298]|nr:hypothetical protein B484DRAFT_432016 [Ochromonadaceae sp. CCMP2298]|mmetsp:Transcript_9351/g.20704  ORF Transcript_9351/g.20704 Transcript_9351/m.20704 type:complete len:153 (+) Transcript_9351:175-633(+)|eukprot:CAMPEP_0173197468 /NCGR_PEP_ID=MMETSP1141-20130122/16180_1 /TAXON_ID=483371 /ORGANISM="non described non described, Strain CCMP2298" /LENGTH=152 /DNA_ID=CAMNT_0014122217 /DNA_START=99 /DNA_END=557 /DNA_ORIENTATION=+
MAFLVSAPPQSISSILESTLDLIGNELDGADSGLQRRTSNAVTASQVLLSERSKVKRSIDGEDFVALDSSRPAITPFYEQISSSRVDDPKYWKSGTVNEANKNNHNKSKSHYSNKQNKAHKSRSAKGEAYKDRFSAKQDRATEDRKGKMRKA